MNKDDFVKACNSMTVGTLNINPELVLLKEYEDVHNTRWHKLFGTPERAARTLAKACGECDEDLPCCECPLSSIIGRKVYEPEILEWLRSDA